MHQDFYVVVMQLGGSHPKPPQRFQKEAFLRWAAKLHQGSAAPIHAVYEACGFGFGLQRALTALGIATVGWLRPSRSEARTSPSTPVATIPT